MSGDSGAQKAFKVLQQDSQATVGEYRVRYQAVLVNYPQVQVEQDEPFTVLI